jgi:formamidopyrimidine-DNA glycosylase
MPELPEVETTLRGIQPHIQTQMVSKIIVRNHSLRWPIPANLDLLLKGQIIQSVERRGKYILLRAATGTVILHLGMSGSLRILTQETPPQKHDHLDIIFADHTILRLTDPRRFGACLWTEDNPLTHFLLKNLGPEPLKNEFTGKYLYKTAQKRKVAVKTFIMNSHIVVGVGNIYAAEALFAAGIHPETPAKDVSQKQYDSLVEHIKTILKLAIKKGGTTLKDFVNSKGKPGYFSMQLKVYGRADLPCLQCKTPLEQIRLGQRGTVYCPKCQKIK